MKKILPSFILAFALLALAALSQAQAGLVSAQWLYDNLENPNLLLIDVRSSIDDGGDRASFEQAHIPGSLYSSYTDDGWRENRGGVTGLLPSVAALERLVGSLGITPEHHVVVIPAGSGPTDFGSAARVYWTLKYLGHAEVSLLNGGFNGWQAEGFPVASGSPEYHPVRYTAEPQPALLADIPEVESRLASRPQSLVDARPEAFFTGQTQAGPVAAPGTLPGAINFEHQSFLVERNGVWYLDNALLNRQLAQKNLSLASDLVTFCNTGHWAATDWFAFSEVAGLENIRLYDGSMAEWAHSGDRPLQVPPRGISRLIQRLQN